MIETKYTPLQAKDLDLDAITITCTNCGNEDEFSREILLKGSPEAQLGNGLGEWMIYCDDQEIIRSQICPECFSNGDYHCE